MGAFGWGWHDVGGGLVGKAGGSEDGGFGMFVEPVHAIYDAGFLFFPGAVDFIGGRVGKQKGGGLEIVAHGIDEVGWWCAPASSLEVIF